MATASNDSVPSAEAEEEGLEAEMMEDGTRDRTVSEVWMDFDILCKCFRLLVTSQHYLIACS